MVLDDKDDRLQRVIEDVLSDGEEVQWCARPRQGPVLTPPIGFLVVFPGAPIIIGAVAGTVGLLGGDWDAFHGQPMVLIAAFWIVFYVIALGAIDAFVRAKTAYFLTDRRVGIAYAWPISNVQEIPHGDWTSLNFARFHKNSGQMTFESKGDDKRAIKWVVLEDFDAAMSAAKCFRKPS